jgi:hypothetical protein
MSSLDTLGKKSWNRSIIADIIGLQSGLMAVAVGEWRALKPRPYRTPHYNLAPARRKIKS